MSHSSAMQSTTAIFEDILVVAKNIAAVTNITRCPSPIPVTFDAELPDFCLPAPLYPQLIQLGVPYEVAEKLSTIFLRQAEELKTSAQRIARATCAQLLSLPHSNDMSSEKLFKRVFEAHRQRYRSTLETLEQEAVDLARSHLATIRADSSQPSMTMTSTSRIKKCKRQFKSEYLPLFEFAFEKDRFPNREDKKHLAKISGMSYRQVCVWFQNRRCRHASRAKSRHITPPPQTIDEMKERLSESAREALSKPQSPESTQTQNTPAMLPHEPQNPASPPICVLKDEEISSPDSTGREASQEVGGYESEECDELKDNGHMQENHDFGFTSNSASFDCKPTSLLPNPLYSPKTPITSAFPTVYKPSKLTSDPFVVEHQPWIREPRHSQIRPLINPTSEILEDILGGFNSMEVDDIEMSAEVAPKSNVTVNASTGRLEKPLPRRRTATPSLSHAPTRTSSPTQRTFSSSSSGSSGSWSSEGSTPLSRSSSYSTMPSSIFSSPHLSEVSLPTSSEYTIDALSDYALSPFTETSPSVDEESLCNTPVEGVTAAGPFDLASAKLGPAWEPKQRVDAWMTGVSSTQEEKDAASSKWEQLLAAAAVATPCPT